jgi:hypothetical protein
VRARERTAGGWELVVVTGEREMLELEIRNLDSATDCAVQVACVGHARGLVKGVAAHPKSAHAATVGLDGVVRLWDLAAKKCVYACSVDGVGDGGISCVAWRGADGDQLAVGTASGLVVVFDVLGQNTLTELREACRHSRGGKGAASTSNAKAAIMAMRYSPDGALLAVGASDKIIELLDANDGYARRGVCKGHGGVVVGLDWSESGGWLQSWCDLGELKYWYMTALRPGTTPNAPSEYKLHSRPYTLYAERWDTMECPIAWAAVGTWGEDDGEGTAVARARDKDRNWIVSGGASGEVRMFSYPACGNADRAAYKAHAYPPVGFVHLPQSGLLLSVGGEDLTLLQWRVR